MVTTRGNTYRASADPATLQERTLAKAGLGKRKQPANVSTGSNVKKQRKAPVSDADNWPSNGATRGDHALAVIASVDCGKDDEKNQKQVTLDAAFGGGDLHDTHATGHATAKGLAAAADMQIGPDMSHHKRPLKQAGLKGVDEKEDRNDNLKSAITESDDAASKHNEPKQQDETAESPAKSEAIAQGGAKHNRRQADNSLVHPAEHKQLALDKSEHHIPKKRDGRKNQQVEAAREMIETQEPRIVQINRAPMLTLWAKVVAERQGFSGESAATFGRAISGMLAQSRGQSLGIFEEKDKDAPRASVESDRASVFGMNITVSQVEGTIVAMDSNGKALTPKQALGYLHRGFGDDLEETQRSMQVLAAAYSPDDIGAHAYKLYEKFRPDAGWGQKGNLDLNFIEALAKNVDVDK